MSQTLAQKLVEIITGISLAAECEIGDGLYIGHYGCIIVAPESRIGHNCSLAQNVTIGVAGTGGERGAPVIGNRVFIGAHSVIVGRITVGDDAVVGVGLAGRLHCRPRPCSVGAQCRGSEAYARHRRPEPRKGWRDEERIDRCVTRKRRAP